MEILAPKVYHGWAKEKGGEWEEFHAAKGIGGPEKNWEAIRNKKAVTSERLRGFRTGARKNEFFKRDKLTRTVTGGYGDRVLGKDGRTYPRHVSEFRKVAYNAVVD
jgi:hypothetical protein